MICIPAFDSRADEFDYPDLENEPTNYNNYLNTDISNNPIFDMPASTTLTTNELVFSQNEDRLMALLKIDRNRVNHGGIILSSMSQSRRLSGSELFIKDENGGWIKDRKGDRFNFLSKNRPYKVKAENTIKKDIGVGKSDYVLGKINNLYSYSAPSEQIEMRPTSSGTGAINEIIEN